MELISVKEIITLSQVVESLGIDVMITILDLFVVVMDELIRIVVMQEELT